MPAKKPVQIGAGDDLFRWVIGPPFGTEYVKVIASKKPIEKLATKELRAKRFNPVTKSILKDAAAEVAETDAKDWTESDVEINTYAATQSEPTVDARRYGVFFGVSQHEFNAVVEESSEGKRRLNLPTPDRDAKHLERLMREVGQLKDSRVYTSEQSTRKQLEETITRWLPSVTKPGDTVFIYFSGHGTQVPDDNGDEADGLDEVLVTHDFISAGILDTLLGKAKQGQLNPAVRERVAALAGVFRRAAIAEQGSAAVARATGVSDDLFARWLQRLDGRRVVVVLDICHAGGFATQEKGLEAAKAGGVFDFCDGEASRLKDIGQPDSALFTACGAQESAMTRGDEFPARLGPLSVLTSYVIDLLLKTKGPLELNQTNEYCVRAMDEYFTERNRELQAARHDPLTPHHPHLMNYCRKPVYLKP
ncbi:MAG: caspase family protein [Planctomycetia bacterium]|nr:caspase family protein [Planctomycetia bacterium]